MTPREDCERLLQEFMPLVTAQLEEHGGFYPFAGVLTGDGKTAAARIPVESDDPQPGEVVLATLAALRRNAATGKITATALFADARVLLPGSAEQADAVQARLDHRDNYSVVVYFPYKIAGGKLAIGPSFLAPGEGRIFTREDPAGEATG